MEKFIIEKEDKEAVYLMYADEDGDVMVEGAYLTPYIEPDREKAAADAFQRGYEHAKHECADCRKIRADTEQELADKAYQKGLSDAWDAARKLVLDSNHGGLTNYDIEEIFGVDEEQAIINYSASEAIEKIRQYEQEEKITKGDVVRIKSAPEVEILVTYADEEHVSGIALTEVDGCCEIGDQYTDIVIHKVEKTGRHYEIAEVLEKMREDAT